ncbi:hypothetical protein [Cyanobium gracile]|uniref:Polysaccharide chain length determinant N-terminal domain-containing protein n=1 Tax=Cyanobium gracile (strain ATCC 27147 / PCC 6307) TaxID=292564 RepID=K9P2F3_CYAGP|nr:hypothetical protein [Cyanobium gracile]AFY27562.1 hypothetical protein Cyagr_0368 [Cyanobium gracile PCC 6307]
MIDKQELKTKLSQKYSQLPFLFHWLSRNRWNRYYLLMGMANGFIWISALLYLLLTKPIYTSRWALILPSTSSATNLNLPDIGQATSSSGSGLGSSTYDTRANYEYIFESEQVIKEAARLSGIKSRDFGKPKIKLIDNTTMMQFEVSGRSAKEAMNKSMALYQSAQKRLNELREGEMRQREIPAESILMSVQKKLQDAQQKVTDFKFKSGLTSSDQVRDLSGNIEQLRRQRAEVLANEQSAAKRLMQLSASLGLSSSQAADAFQLQVDQIFQQHLKDYSEATSSLRLLAGKFGPNNPRVIKEKNRQRFALRNLLQRSRQILGKDLPPLAINRLALSTVASNSGRDSLLQSLVNVAAEQRALSGQAKELDVQINNLEQRLRGITKPLSTLESLMRNEQIAQAVFASTLAQLDLGQGDLFSAYPLIQMAVEPTMPDKPSAPKTTFVLAGAVAGSFFSSFGLWLLWVRKPWIKKLSRWISP